MNFAFCNYLVEGYSNYFVLLPLYETTFDTVAKFVE